MLRAQREKLCNWLDECNGQKLPPETRPAKWKILLGGVLSALYLAYMPEQEVDPTVPPVQQAAIITAIVVGLIMAAVSLVLSELLRPKPKFQDAKPAGNGDFKFPTAVEGRPVPVIWGRNKIAGPNVVWWGDFTQLPIKDRIKTGLWSKKTITTGWRYNVGMQMGLCHGTSLGGTRLKRVWIGDKEVFSGSLDHEDSTTLNDPNLFGGDKFGTGGINGEFRFHDGRYGQAVNSYLSNQQDGSNTPGYGGTTYVVWEGGYIGNSTQIQKWSFELQRFPDNLGLTGSNHRIGDDANPAECIYESLIDADWGAGRNTSKIDLASFQAAGETLFTEGNGFSMVLDRSIPGSELRQLILDQIDGVLFQDRVTGLYTLKLARDDYVVASQQRLTDDNMMEIKDFSRQTWDNTTNQVRIGFTDRSRDYFDTFAVSNDMANQRMQDNEIVSATIKYPGVKSKTLAVALAARELRFLGYPLAKCTVVVNREFWDTNIGDVKLFNDAQFGLVDLPMRVLRVDYGNFTSNKITLTLMQDIFSLETGFFGEPEDPSWTDPVQGVAQIPLDDQFVQEAPKAVIDRDPNFPDRLNRVWCGAIAQGGENAIEIRQRNHPTVPVGDFAADGEVFGMTIVGELNVGININDPNPTTSIQLNANESSIPILDFAFDGNVFSEATIGQDLAGLMYIDGEFIGVEAVISSTSTTITMGAVHRGLLDSVPKNHLTGTKVWILFSYMGLSDTDLPDTQVVDVKLITESRDDTLLEATALTNQVTFVNRYDRPYPPSRVDLNGVRFDETLVTLDNVIVNPSGDDQGINYAWFRRDFELTDEVAALDVDDTSVSSHTQEQRLTVYGIDANGVVSAVPLTDSGWAAGTTGQSDRASILGFHNGVDTNPSIRSIVETRHTNGGVLESINQVSVDSTVDSPIIGGLFNFGKIPANSPQGPYTIANGALDLNFELRSAIGGNVEYRINAGAWTNLITAGGTTGQIANALLTTSDLIYIRHLDNAGTPDHTFMDVEEGTTNVAYGILDTTASFDALMGWYPFNESGGARVSRFGSNAPDFDDNNTVLSVAGQANYGDAANMTEAAGTVEYLSIDDADMADMQFPGTTGDAWTVTFWVKHASFAVNPVFQQVIGKADYDSGSPFTNRSWYVFSDDSSSNRMVFVAIGASGTAYSAIKSSLSTETWYHCALVWERGQTIKFYLDASVTAGSSIGEDLQTSSEPLSVGASFRTGAVEATESQDDMDMQDLRIYHRVLSGSEITAMHGLGQPL